MTEPYAVPVPRGYRVGTRVTGARPDGTRVT
ncbi:hypothetical protein RKD20_003479 [Streptomyces sp. SLBN-8D4]